MEEQLESALAAAKSVMDSFWDFRNAHFDLIAVIDEPDWEEFNNAYDPTSPIDPELPQRPPGVPRGIYSSHTHATHTTTTSSATFVPSEAQSGSHPAAGPASFTVVTDQTPDNTANVQAHHGLGVQVEMAHSASLSGSSAAVLDFAAVVNQLPVITEVIKAWMLTLPASLGITYAGVDILDPHTGGPVTLAIQFAQRSDHVADATGELPAAAVAILKLALQEAAAVWEHDQESAPLHANAEAPPDTATPPSTVAPREADSTPTPLTVSAPDHSKSDVDAAPPADPLQTPAHAPLHHGFDGLRLSTSTEMVVAFAAPPGEGDDAVITARSGDWQAIGAMIAHWMECVDPGLADNIVTFEIEDWGAEYGGVVLALLLNEMQTAPSAAATAALQQDVQAYLSAPDLGADGARLIGLNPTDNAS